ncbi:uncharacterized protein (DUF2141 family) [Novosphingobium sp. PhB165]|uniref:DUF2141 domain-containing protein n=1 Tax=Novosphingobium sp. PhB165 TaxID=2485105 RepID=UPI00104B993F|nr:DUF2141 domain-containing protein [Novosphingobium sp. PhB165]TCM16066.1 uncharacterized protein (DUF2141 family) [Novosphingobium sp. PhB165]
MTQDFNGTVNPTFPKLKVLACLAPCLLGASPPASDGGVVLTVDVGNVRVSKGYVRVAICPESQFLKDDCPFSGEAPARVGVTRVLVHSLPPGRYAAQAFLDENSNGKVDRALFGIPKEGVGFSNDAKIVLGPPKFSEAAFHFDGAAQIIHFNLRYFMGAKGPGGQ